MIDLEQFLGEVIWPALRFLDPEIPESKTAAKLLLGTALQESRLTYLRQIGGGPALGVFQMEPNTHDDIWDNWLAYRRTIRLKIANHFGSPDPDRLITDLLYAAVMCRVHYYRAPDALPAEDDIDGQARYWKVLYNTHLGHGTETQYRMNWEAEVAETLFD